MKKLFYVLISALLLVGVFTGCEKPEKVTCAIQGMVTDKETGNPLSGVTIELQPISKQVQTTENGTYIIENLKTGSYTLKAQKEGYANYIKEGIKLTADQILQMDIEMEDEYKAKSDYTITTYGLNMEMVYVEGGEFEMGATEEQGEDAKTDERPVRRIKLEGYHIGRYEVTRAQWWAMAEDMPHFEGDSRPVGGVSWEMAKLFCKILSEATGKNYVLPTEAQWEYAARGGNKSQHYKYAGSNDVNEVAWYKVNSDGKTHPVGSKKANELGIYDMNGNIYEWCSDWYANDEYGVNDTENPQGPTNGSYRVARGGSWNNDADYCRVSSRDYSRPVDDAAVLGFRIVCLP